ncbi:MAG: hypothetical protein LBU56_00575 [Rickettsiales bacterium]|jgi:hypothetical protein|nr:hypothetical protein [Rickettsiales bacterium]
MLNSGLFLAENNSQVPQNSFYKSVHYIDNVVVPVKNVLFGVKSGQTRKYEAVPMVETAV